MRRSRRAGTTRSCGWGCPPTEPAAGHLAGQLSRRPRCVLKSWTRSRRAAGETVVAVAADVGVDPRNLRSRLAPVAPTLHTPWLADIVGEELRL